MVNTPTHSSHALLLSSDSPNPDLDDPDHTRSRYPPSPFLTRRSSLPRFLSLAALLLCLLSTLTTAHAQPTTTVQIGLPFSQGAGPWKEASATASTCACKPSSEGTKHDTTFAVEAAFIPVLVILSGVTAGLTLGYMSLDGTQLQVLAKTGTESQKKAARKVIPIRQNGHLLLITLLISNMIFNEALPVVSENVLGGGVQAVVISTILIVIFSEIIPQSVCSRFGLQIGAAMVWPVRVLIYGLFVIAWPVAKILELLLGAHSGIVYRRAELKELVAMHAQTSGHGDLQDDTVAIVGATLDLQTKVVRDAMTPLSSVFMLPITAKLDYQTLGEVLTAGHSRIPVYEDKVVETAEGNKTKRKIIGVLLTKQLILLDPEDAVPLRDIPMNTLPLVSEDLPLLQILNTFQLGRSHMAIVCPRRSRPALETIDSLGATTATEDELERGEAGKKDKDGSSAHSHEGFLHGLFRRSRSGSGSSISTTTASGNEGKKAHKGLEGEKEQEKTGPLAEARASRLSLADLDDEYPQGVITLEDVIEELIGEEILDETDADGAQPPSMLHYIPPEAYGKVGNLSGPPPAPSALLAHQAKQQQSSSTSSTKGMGIAGAVGRFGKGMVRSRSAPGKPRERENSGGVAPGVGNTMMGDGTPILGSGGVGIAGALGVSMGAFGGGRKRSASPAAAASGNNSSSASTPTTASTRFATPKVVDFAQSPPSDAPATPLIGTTATASVTGQPEVSEPQPLALIRERSRSDSDPSPAHPTSTAAKTMPASAPSPSLPPILRRPSPNPSPSASTVPSPTQSPSSHASPLPLPAPSLLSDAVLLERGRRVLLAQGADPSQLNSMNLRRVGAAHSQPGSRSATPAPPTASASASTSVSGHLTPATNEVSEERGGGRSASAGTRTKGTAFKSPPVGGRPLPYEARANPGPARASMSVGQGSPKVGGEEKQEKAE
ncbi:hypothetical protein JCM5296_006575 [Sporobolomyces johnsonii]